MTCYDSDSVTLTSNCDRMDKEHFLRLILLAETVSYDGRAAPDCLGSLRKQTRKPTLSQHHIIIICAWLKDFVLQ